MTLPSPTLQQAVSVLFLCRIVAIRDNICKYIHIYTLNIFESETLLFDFVPLPTGGYDRSAENHTVTRVG